MVLLVEYSECADKFYDAFMVNMLKRIAKFNHVYFVENIDKPDYSHIVNGTLIKTKVAFEKHEIMLS